MNLEKLIEIAWKWTEPGTDSDGNELKYWQDRIAYSFLLFGVSFGFLVLIFSAHLSIVEDLWLIAILDVAMYIWILVLFFKRSLPQEIRVFSIGATCYLLGLALLITIGPFGGGGPIWLFIFPVITAVLSNVRFSLSALGINIVTIIIIGWLIKYGWFDWPYIPEYSTQKWFVLSLNFILLNTISTIAVTLLIRSLNFSVVDKKHAMIALEEKNIQLHSNNQQLREEIDGRKKAESSLQRSEEAKLAISEWVDFIAHELRTPINGVVGFADLGLNLMANQAIEDESKARADQNNPQSSALGRNATVSSGSENPARKSLNHRLKKTTDFFNTIKYSGKRLTKLVDDLLDLSKLQANRMEFMIQPVSMVSLVQEARMEMDPLLLEKELQLNINHEEMSHRIECDGFRIGQVVRNLLANAVKFSPQGKKISVFIVDAPSSGEGNSVNRSLNNRSGLKISIIDEGPGIPVDEITSVFEKFRQSRFSRIGEGTGLGLPICKEIVEAHGGTIWAESKEGQGARMHFILPYSSPLKANR